MLSVVIPAYNEQETVAAAAEEIGHVLFAAEIPHELIFIDDGSKDRTWECICAEAQRRCDVRGARFSRNFGKEAAIYAGLKAAKGDYVATLDADLQDPPALLPELYRAVTEEGYDCAAAVQSSFIRSSAAQRGSICPAPRISNSSTARLWTCF